MNEMGPVRLAFASLAALVAASGHVPLAAVNPTKGAFGLLRSQHLCAYRRKQREKARRRAANRRAREARHAA